MSDSIAEVPSEDRCCCRSD